MLALNDLKPAFRQLSAVQSLARVDFLTTTIAELVQEVGRNVDGRIVKSILEINQMLALLREDLAMVDDACNRSIITQVEALISALRGSSGR